MARYWVGGTGNTSDTAHWSNSDGGAGGFSAPSATEDVFFTALSSAAAYVVTVDSTLNCRDITFAAPATGNLTLAGSATINFYGNFALYAGLVRTYTGALNGSATSGTKTLTSAGVSLASIITAAGVGSTLQLADNLTTTTSLICLTGCALDLNGKTVSCGSFIVANSGTASLIFGAATVVASGNVSIGASANVSAASLVSFSAGAAMDFGGKSYGGTVTLSPNTQRSLVGANTFANLTILGSTNKVSELWMAADQVVTGTLTISGNSVTNRVRIASTVKGTARTLTAATVVVSNADFQDIAGAGAGSWNLSAITGGSGDCGGCSGITFTSALDLYWQHGASASYNWSDATRWFLATNGGGGAGRVPLPQDRARFDANSFAAGSKTVVQDMRRFGSADWTGVTNTPTWSPTTAASFFGAITLASGMTLVASTATYTYEGRGAATITSAGKAWGKPFVIDCAGGSLTMLDAMSITAQQLTLSSGTFNSNGFTFTASFFSTNGTATRALLMGASVWILDGGIGNPWNIVSASGFSLSAGTSTIRLTGALTAARTFAGAGLSYYNLENATTGAFALQFTGSNTFNNIHIDASAAARTIQFTAGTTTTVASMTRDPGTNAITIGSITAASHTIAKSGGGKVVLDALTISRSTATPSSTWYAPGGTDGGNNTGWTFAAPEVTLEGTDTNAASDAGAISNEKDFDAIDTATPTDSAILSREFSFSGDDVATAADSAEISLEIGFDGTESNTITEAIELAVERMLAGTDSNQAADFGGFTGTTRPPLLHRTGLSVVSFRPDSDQENSRVVSFRSLVGSRVTIQGLQWH